jgi:hypothetical protein
MNKNIPHIIMLTAITGFLAIAGNPAYAQTTDPLLTDSVDQSAFPQITAQPVDQTVPIGSSVTVSVQANNANGYQWLINGVPADGQTNTSLTIASVGIGDVGFYSCEVYNGAEMVPTRTATVDVETTASATTANVATASPTAAKASLASVTTSSAMTGNVAPAGVLGGGPITVFGMPYAGSGSSGGCPGKFTGYVYYSKPYSQGWGWTPSGTVHTVTDGSGRTDTKIQYVGLYGDSGCAQTTISIPNPTFSPAYQFCIYFTNNVPTNAYPMVLMTGFNQ